MPKRVRVIPQSEIATQETQGSQATVVRRRSKKNYGRTTTAPLLKVVGKVSSGIPENCRMKFKHVETQSITLTAGAGSYNMRCNGMFDPNHTGTGHQPYYYDQMMALYNHYVVLNAYCRVSVLDDVSSSLTGVIIIDDDATTSALSFFNKCERPGAYVQTGNPAVGPPIKLTKAWSVTSAFGADPLANDQLKGTISTNPTEEQFFHIAFWDAQTTPAGSVDVLIEVWYDAYLFERKDVAGS